MTPDEGKTKSRRKKKKIKINSQKRQITKRDDQEKAINIKQIRKNGRLEKKRTSQT